MPPEKLSLNTAIVDAFRRLHSITAVITDHSLQTRIITSRLTPKIGLHVPLVQEKFRKHLPHELPATEKGWKSVNALHLARRMVHRGVATQCVTELAEDEECLSIAISYSENGFKHNFLLRFSPELATPAVALLLPTSWGVDSALKKTKHMIIPIIDADTNRLSSWF
jgi:ent-kaurene oxidase